MSLKQGLKNTKNQIQLMERKKKKYPLFITFYVIWRLTSYLVRKFIEFQDFPQFFMSFHEFFRSIHFS